MKKWQKRAVNYSLCISFLILIVLFIWINSDCFVSKFEELSEWLFPENLNRNGELFKIGLNVLGAIGIAIGLVIAFKRAKAIENGVLRQKEAQTDERFKNAVEHLGNDKEPIILGGVAELHQIAKANKSEYSEVVFNILCSYVRSSANYYKKDAREINFTVNQTIINALFKHYTKKDYPYSGLNANLKFSNFSEINFDNANLSGADFSFCYMPSIKNSNLDKSNLTKAIFREADIENVNFRGADLYQSLFNGSKIKNCNMEDISFFNSVYFIDSTLNEVCFSNSVINNCKFICVNISNSIFINSEISSTSFAGSDLLDISFSSIKIFKNNDLRLTGFDNVKVNISIEKSKFNGCRMANPYRFKSKEIINSVGKKTDLRGIDLDHCSLKECDMGKFTDLDAEEIINDYYKLKAETIFEVTKKKNDSSQNRIGFKPYH